MAVPEAMISWGYRFGATSYNLRVEIDDAAETLTFNAAGSALSTSTDYYMGGNGQATDILYFLKYCLETHTGDAGTVIFDVYLDSSQKVQIDIVDGGTDFNILWSNSLTTLDPALFGFGHVDTGDVSTVTSTAEPQGIWTPGLPITLDDKRRDQIVGGVATTVSGKVRVSNIATAEKTRRLQWTNLAKSQVREEYATINWEAFQYAWVNSIALGRPFQYWPDDLALAVTNRATYYPKSLSDPMLRSGPFNLRWDVEMDCVEDSASDYTQTYCLDCRSGGSATAPVVISGDSAWSFGCWFYRTTSGAADSFLGQWKANDRCWYWQVDALDDLYVRLADDLVSPSTITVATSAGSVYSTNTWTHFAFTFSAGTCKLYVDGIQMATTTTGSPPSAMTAGADTFGIGQDGGGSGNDSSSYFDDLCFYNKALTEVEVKALYAGTPTDISGLTRWWAFERDGADHVTGARVVPYGTSQPAVYAARP